MRGAFQTVAGGQAVAEERWSVASADGRDRLVASGEIREGRPRRWQLEAAVTTQGTLESMEWQLTAAPPPTEVTTVALRSLGEHVFITRIPPGGVPDRVETAFAPGSLVLGPSVSLLALLAGRAQGQAGMARRSLFVRVDEHDLSVRLEDGMVLHGRRVRGKGADGKDGWIRSVELRTAADAARQEAVLQFDASGAPVEAAWPLAIPPRAASLSSFEP
ncbi:MAG TPA: hypothetical protein VGB42_11585 [Candidatus Thermoplasmatota archaeon]